MIGDTDFNTSRKPYLLGQAGLIADFLIFNDLLINPIFQFNDY